nr:septum formation inhibitor Maf [Desulfobacula sp.]
MKPINLEKLLLASRSPRRKELLEQTGIELEILPSDIDEEDIPIKNPVEYVKTLSFMKAEKVSTAYPDSWILGADTIVVIRDQILGKPESEHQAMEMLRLLSDREHLVFTGFCIMNQHKQALIKTAVETRVWFKSLSDQEIRWYVSTREPFDKAGGYGIQGLGAFLVRKISGSYSNVVGLPVCEVVEALMELKIIEMGA